MDKLKMHSPDLIAANVGKLAELFPNCVTETRDTKGEVKKRNIGSSSEHSGVTSEHSNASSEYSVLANSYGELMALVK